MYDGSGNRIKKIVRTQGGDYESTSYIGEKFEYKTNGTDEQTIAHIMDGNSRIVMIRKGDDFGDTTPAVKYNLEDHLGSSRILLETNGSIINNEEYYPFGETSFGSYAKKRYRYSGKEKDEESGLYYYGARYYMPWACKFISCDPMAGKSPQWSSYVSFNDNPIKFIDPDGFTGTDWIKKAGSNTWKWDSNVKAKQLHEIRPDGTELAKAGHEYPSYGTVVTLLDGGKWKQSPKIVSAPAKIIDLTQNSQGWEPNPYGDQLKGKEVIPTLVIASSAADMWAINDWRFKQFCNSIDKMALGTFAIGFSPLVIAEAIVIAPALKTFFFSTAIPKLTTTGVGIYKGVKYSAKVYHNTFGKHGGYWSFGGEIISQTSSQLYETGGISFNAYDRLAMTSSLFVRDGDNMAAVAQGIQGTFVSITGSGYHDFREKSATFNGLSFANGIYGAVGGPPIITDIISGSSQGVLENLENKKAFGQ